MVSEFNTVGNSLTNCIGRWKYNEYLNKKNIAVRYRISTIRVLNVYYDLGFFFLNAMGILFI